MKIKYLTVLFLYVFANLLGQESVELDIVSRHIFRANALAYNQKYQEALTEINQAIRADPYANRAYKVRAHVYVALKELPKALNDLNHVLAQIPDSANLLVDRAIVYLLMGQKKLALQDVDRALEIAPKSVFALSVRQRIIEED